MAPGPIIGIGEVLWDLLPTGPRAGGAPFNFAFQCCQLGHAAIIVSRVGDDELGRTLRGEVRKLGLSDEFIQIDHDHPTGTVQVDVDAHGQPSYTITENVAWDFLEWEERFAQLIQSARAVCFGTLAQRRRVSRETIQRLLSSESDSRIRVCDINLRPPFVDSEVIGESLNLADWLKVNESEWITINETDNTPENWVHKRKVGLLCITHGAAGCSIVTTAQSVRVPGIEVHVADTVGAGDAFTAGLVTQILEGNPLEKSARFANALAAIVASKPGGTPAIRRAEVKILC